MLPSLGIRGLVHNNLEDLTKYNFRQSDTEKVITLLTMNLNLTVGQLLELGLGLSAIYNLALVVILLHRKLCHCVVRREI